MSLIDKFLADLQANALDEVDEALLLGLQTGRLEAFAPNGYRLNAREALSRSDTVYRLPSN